MEINVLGKYSPRLGQTSLITTPVFSLGSSMNADSNCIMVQLICRASNSQMHLLQLCVFPEYMNLYYTAIGADTGYFFTFQLQECEGKKSRNKKMR